DGSTFSRFGASGKPGAVQQYRNVLLPNGDVTLCSMDFERRHVLGNLLYEGYSALFEKPVFREIVDRMNGADGFLLCRMCEFADPNDRT
ncbi:MAG: hypothetical protein EOR88_08830, partial [Mesorhizobium sp.]